MRGLFCLSRRRMNSVMLEHFSVRSRKAVSLMRLKAGERGAAAIGIEDLLAALIIEDQGNAEQTITELLNLPSVPIANAAPTFAVFDASQSHSVQQDRQHPQGFIDPKTASELLRQIELHLPISTPIPASEEMHTSPDLENVLRSAGVIAREMHQHQVQPLHLLAVAIQGDSFGAEAFKNFGITPTGVMDGLRCRSEG